VVYAGGSGLYKSVDGGATWSRADRGLDPQSAVSTLAIDPLHPSTLYAGQDKRLFKSVDGGATWQQTGGSSPFLFDIRSLAIHPRFPATIFAATDAGLYLSSNGGASWRLLTKGLPPAPYIALAVGIDPTSPRRMFASILGQPSGLFSSFDGGFSWQHVPSDLLTIESLAIDPRSPKSLWAIAQNGLFRSTDDGRSWTRSLQTPIFDPFLALAFPATQKNLIYAGGLTGLFRSLDGGATWSSLSQSLPGKTGVHSFLASSATTLIVGVDSPPRDTGLYKSTDGGTSWTRSDRSLTNSYVTSLAVDAADSNTLWVASLARLFKSTDRGQIWSPIPLPPEIGDSSGSSAYRIVPSPVDPAAILLELLFGQTWRSRDGGQNWVMAGVTSVASTEVLKADPLKAATFWAGGYRGLGKSTDGGDTWTPQSLPAANAVIFDLAFSPSFPSTVYASGETFNPDLRALLLRSDDAGATWTAAQDGLPAAGIGPLAVDPQHPETVYTVTHLSAPDYSGDIYKTVNGGSTWSLVNNVFHDRIVQFLAAAPSGVLYAAVKTDNVYESDDGGLSWAPLGESPRPSFFTFLTADPRDPCRVYAGTLNRGLLAFTKKGTAVCP
jgi:photosystem II stability/assembly factor-like uncharacterized protein